MNRLNNLIPRSAHQLFALIVLLTLLSCILTAMHPAARAEGVTAPTEVATPSDMPQSPATMVPEGPEPEFEIKIRPPTGWVNSNSVQVRVVIEDVNGAGWKKIEVRIDNGERLDMTKQYQEDEKLLLELADNCRVTVRVTDKRGSYHSESESVRCIDREPPSLAAAVSDGRLHVSAMDDLSGVAGIRVNGYLFANLQNGVLDMDMENLLNKYEKLEIYAFDFAGNTSAAVTLDNPYYSTPTPVPTNTPAPTAAPTATKKPSSSGSTKKATAAPTEAPTPTAAPTEEPTAVATTPPSAVQTLPAYWPYPTYWPYPSAAPSVAPGTPFQASGNMATLDLLYSANTNKQFITVQSRNGQTYFLVIDYDKPIDEENEIYETYFLNLVDDRDLLAVLDDEDKPTATPIIIEVTPEPTAIPTEAPPTPEPVKPSPSSLDSLAPIASLVIFAGIGVAAFFFLRKNGKGKKMNEYDYGSDEDDDEDDTEEA